MWGARVLDAAPVQCDHKALIPIIEACAATGSLALVGAPVEERGRRFIAILAIDGAGARPAYRKTWLGGNEPTQFHAGDGPTVLDVDGWRLGLGICKDTGAPQHVAGTAALNVDAYLAGLVHLPQELPEQEARAVVIVRACRAFVVFVFASFAGPTGDIFAERPVVRRSTRRKALPWRGPDRTGPRRCCPGHPRLRSSHCRNVYRSRSAIAPGLAEHDHFVPIGVREREKARQSGWAEPVVAGVHVRGCVPWSRERLAEREAASGRPVSAQLPYPVLGLVGRRTVPARHPPQGCGGLGGLVKPLTALPHDLQVPPGEGEAGQRLHMVRLTITP